MPEFSKNGITKRFAQITVDSVSPHQYKDGVFQAQVRQEVETVYPAKRVTNSRASMLFSEKEFDLGEGQTFNSTRVTWIPVPEGTTAEEVEKLLAKLPDAMIYNVYSNNVMDVLTAEQIAAIQAGLRTQEEFENSLLIRDKDGNELPTVQYRQSFFSDKAREDEDYRTVSGSSSNVQEEQEVATQKVI